MGIWNFILPEAIVTRVTNPSLESGATTDWVNAGMATFAVTTDYAKFGAYSLHLIANSQNDNAYIDAEDFTAAATVTVSAWVRATSADVQLRLGSVPVGGIVATVNHTGSGEWERLSITGPLAGGETTARVIVRDTRAAGWDAIYVDAVDAVETGTLSTHCDGEQPGCEWLGAQHLSMSRRSAISRAGGVITDFDDYNFNISGMFGAGMLPIINNVDSFALLPGGELNSVKEDMRTFNLAGWVRGTSLPDLHANRQSLIRALHPKYLPDNQPVILRYTGAAVDKEITVYYEAGLEGAIRASFECLEQAFAIRFLATDPNYYEIGESAVALDSNDTEANFRIVAARLRDTGQWDALGPPADPGPPVYTDIRAIAVGPDGMVYFGGNFVDFNSVGAADRFVSYNPATGVWAAVGPAGTFADGVIYAIAIAPNGDIYVAGTFTTGGASVADYIAFWNGAAWAAVGIPVAGTAAITAIYALHFDRLANLLIGGDFTRFADVANADYFVHWNLTTTTYGAIGAGGTGIVYAIATDSTNNYYIGGIFINWAGDGDADGLAWWNGTVWAALGIPGILTPAEYVRALAMTADDRLYIGGLYQSAGGTASENASLWNGTAYVRLGIGTGPATTIFALVIGPDGMLYVAGDFVLAGGIQAYGLAKWNGSSWAPLDISLPGPPAVYAIAVSTADPVIAQNYDIWVGFDQVGAGFFAGTAVAINEGTEPTFPYFQITRAAGGTLARLTQIRNELTGKELLFNYSLLIGETLTIYLEPTRKRIISSFFRSQAAAVLANADFGSFNLLPGNNPITCFIDVTGATVAANAVWRDAYASQD